MADKSIPELAEAEIVQTADLFVLQQDNTAKKLSGQTLINFLLNQIDGHGGIQNIQKTGTSGLVDTYRITFADSEFTVDFTVTNGKSITGISKTSSSGLTDTYTIRYNDSTTSEFTVTNGAKGNKGDNAYLWIKYANQKPSSGSSSMGDEPDDWIGVYSGTKSSAPTNPMEYKWFLFKGEKGNTGEAAILTSSEVRYQASSSGTIIPSESWQEAVPPVTPGQFLWTRVIIKFNSGSPITTYSVSRFGIDGTGAVSTVNGVSPDEGGNVELTAEQLGVLGLNGGTMSGPINMNGQQITGMNPPIGNDEPETKGHVSETYLSKTDAESTYLSKTDAESTYLTDEDVKSTYLSKSDAGNTYQKKILTQTNVTVQPASFTSDSTYSSAGYAYRASVAVSGANADMIPTVVFSPKDATSGNLAPVANPYVGGVYIYAKAKPSESVSILTIKLEVV